MKKIITLILLINNLLAQTTTVNPYNINVDMKKYWFYRTKLVNDFMLVGTGQGLKKENKALKKELAELKRKKK